MEKIKKIGWKLLNSVWLIITLVIFLNWVPFIYIGTKVKRKKWLVFGAVYFLLAAISVVAASGDWKSSNTLMGIYLMSWPVSIIHALLVRKEYLFRLERMTDNAYVVEEKALSIHNDVLSSGFEKVEKIKKIAAQIQDGQVRIKLDSIISLADRILTMLDNDPQEIQKAKKFLNYYLDSTYNIIEKYTEIKKQQLNNTEFDKVLGKAEDILGTIEKAFEKQIQRLLENDVYNLEAEMALLDNTIKTEFL